MFFEPWTGKTFNCLNPSLMLFKLLRFILSLESVEVVPVFWEKAEPVAGSFRLQQQSLAYLHCRLDGIG